MDYIATCVTVKMKKKQAKRRRSLVWILLGVILLLYPLVATLWNDHVLREEAQSYSDSVEQIDPPTDRARILQEAREYNQRLKEQGHHAMPPNDSSPGFEEYMKALAPDKTNGALARITIESIKVDLPVYHTSRPSVLYHGAGHMFGSDLPVGGMGTNSVITAHTGMVNASMFDQLPMLKDGAIVKIDVMGEQLYYKVYNRKVVKPDYWEAVTYEDDIDKITLITCTPYGINTDRLLVEAHRVPGPENDAGSNWPFAISWWMILDLILILLVLLIVIYFERKRRKRKAAQALVTPETTAEQ